MRKYKVEFFMKSGNSLTVECDSFNLTLGEITGKPMRYEITNTSKKFYVDLDQIEIVSISENKEV